MRIQICRCVLMALGVGCLALSCSRELQKEDARNDLDGKYDSVYPKAPATAQLDQISKSIFMVNCIGSYRTFFFDEKEKVLLSELSSRVAGEAISRVQYSDNTVRGTATLIFNDGQRIAFLTCAHVVSMPDTVVSYFRDVNRRPTPYIRRVAIKIKQFNFVSPLPDEGSVDVVFCDTAADVAVVGKSVSGLYDLRLPPFGYRFGKGAELRWGTFTYVFSCPAGVKMVTKALTSPSAKDPGKSFFIDATLGGGSSGGIVLAVRDGIPNFELVGIVRIVQAKFSNVLAPMDDGQDVLENSVYEGQAVVTRKAELEYGVTRCISAEVIRGSLLQHQQLLVDRGYNLSEITKH